ncbi:hypothetical protein Acr_07g0017870 [Actinidia rufa]|uniref:DNA ligase ATP-dependent N-terminal domain-containing protein n=1 Tax=Actinidia rufa TaxID=165716 RepID=A0A7J0EYS1_9ERIC|nr:hypothetical protein Acr_07g0017870 [Actinidia rufa]
MGDETKFSVVQPLQLDAEEQVGGEEAVQVAQVPGHLLQGNFFGSTRKLLPSLDRERGSYGLKESVLATCLVDALGMSRESEDARRLFNWGKGGPRTGANAGNFAFVASESLGSLVITRSLGVC